MTDRINLTQLRERQPQYLTSFGELTYEPTDDPIVCLTPAELLALLNVAEAAQAYADLIRPPHADDYEWDDLKAKYGTTLKATLSRFTFGDTAP